MTTTPFDSIESAQEYVRMLCEEVERVEQSIAADIVRAEQAGATRRLEALRLVAHKLHQLRVHQTASRTILNDLRTLRRLLLGDVHGAA
jgi:hypothetical protein